MTVTAALLLFVIVFVAGCFQTLKGVVVRIAGLGRCGDVRDVILQVLPHGGLTLNSQPQKREDLGRRLDDIYRTRWSKHVYVTSDPDVFFSDVIGIIDLAAKHVDHVVIVTPSVLKNATYRGDSMCLDPNLPPGYPPS